MIIVVYSSTKDIKVRPIESALERIYPDGFISLRHRIGENDTGIPSQPVGHKETRCGAELRATILRERKVLLTKCLKEEQGIETKADDNWIYVGVEGGLILNHDKQFADITYVALAQDNGPVIVASADPIVLLDEDKKPYQQDKAPPLHDDKLYNELSKSEKAERDLCIYGHQDGEAALALHQPTFQGYRQKIVEPILFANKIDLYEWSTESRLTREKVIHQAACRAIRNYLDYKTQNLETNLQLEASNKNHAADNLLELVAAYGCVASLGRRYRDMVWMRDLSFMAPTLLKSGYVAQVTVALRGFAQKQETSRATHNDGYSIYQGYGKIPIVYIPESNKEHFLANRIVDWQQALRQYCKENQPDALVNFPVPSNADHSASAQNTSQHELNLVGLNADILTKYYNALTIFRNQLLPSSSIPPTPSFALSRFISNNIENLTPGTRDSEIHFIRALMFLVDALDDQDSKQCLLDEFAPTLSGAVFYLYMNVVDNSDGLPFGADSRDIFADFMYDAKTLCNATYLYQVISKLVENEGLLRKTSFSQNIANQLQHVNSTHQLPLLKLLATNQGIKTALLQAKSDLQLSIRDKLLYNDDHRLNPMDFIPGKRINDQMTPVIPLPPYVTSLINEQDAPFLQGKTIDPQGLALAVLAGLVDERNYPDIIKCFQQCDSDIGVKVFTPISATSAEEREVLLESKGNVVWPNISYRVVQALDFMNTPESSKMAELQMQKLNDLPQMAEWYATKGKNAIYIGGSPMQGWHASGRKANQEKHNHNDNYLGHEQQVSYAFQLQCLHAFAAISAITLAVGIVAFLMLNPVTTTSILLTTAGTVGLGLTAYGLYRANYAPQIDAIDNHDSLNPLQDLYL